MAIAVPDYVAEAASRGLEWHAAGKSGEGVTDQTIREAHNMARGEVSEDKLRRMGPWFQRHRPDMDAPKNKPDSKDFPGAGAVAWALWGGPTSGDIMRTAKWVESKVAALDAEQSAKALASLSPKSQTIETIMPRIFCDIDGTLIDAGQPVENVIEYVENNAEELIILTNRPESDRAKTEKDLEDADIDYDELVMNDTGAPAPEFKAGVIKGYLDKGERVDLFVDNDAANRRAVAALGVKVMDPKDVPAMQEDPEEGDQMEAAFKGVANLGRNKMTLEERLIAAEAAAASVLAERDDLRATVEKLTVGSAAETEALKVEASAKDAKLAELGAALDAAAKESEALKAMVAELEAGRVSASKEAAKIAASVGVEPVAQSPADQDKTAESVDHLATFLALPVGSKERSEYFAKHKTAIYNAAL